MPVRMRHSVVCVLPGRLLRTSVNCWSNTSSSERCAGCSFELMLGCSPSSDSAPSHSTTSSASSGALSEVSSARNEAALGECHSRSMFTWYMRFLFRPSVSLTSYLTSLTFFITGYGQRHSANNLLPYN